MLLAACFIAMLQAEGLAAGRQEHRIRRDSFTPMDPSGDGEAFEEAFEEGGVNMGGKGV